MTLSLSHSDQSLLAAATRALVSPLVQPTFEHWLREVNHTVKEVLWADKASIMFPLSNGDVRTASDEFPAKVLVDYARERLPDQERRWGIRRRSVALGAWSRRLIYGTQLKALYRSEYYNEYLVPNGAFDAVGLTTALDSPDQVVNLYFHHDRPTGRRFGARGLALLRMLYPAFKAGVQASRTLFQQRDLIERLTDALGTGVALTDLAGNELHRNTALRAMAAAEPDWLVVERDFPKVLQACAVAGGWRQGRAGDVNAQLRRVIRTSNATYVVSATPLNQGNLSREVTLALMVERSGAPAFPAAALRERHGLTARELEVARLLCEGATNEHVARTLSITASTARHHTESVMMKLHIHSRAQIAAAIARCRDSLIS